MANNQLPIQKTAGLLYPNSDAIPLAELPPDARPRQLLIIDGTWHQAKTIVRDVPQLRNLPCYRLRPTSAGQYRIRREPESHCLSTLEATVSALRALEPDTVGLDQLMAAFHQMVEDQVQQRDQRSVPRKRSPRTSNGLPSRLLRDPANLVIAYGESTPGRRDEPSINRTPVNWMAERLGSGERFSCLLQQHTPLSDESLQHMQLSADDFSHAVPFSDFRARWHSFLRKRDVLVVYHHRTFELLRNAGAQQPRCLVLKSILRKHRSKAHSLEDQLRSAGIELPELKCGNRADQRLDMATALVRHLYAMSATASRAAAVP